jgi:hypothetical protein
MWTHAKSIEIIERADGKARVYILARSGSSAPCGV